MARAIEQQQWNAECIGGEKNSIRNAETWAPIVMRRSQTPLSIRRRIVQWLHQKTTLPLPIQARVLEALLEQFARDLIEKQHLEFHFGTFQRLDDRFIYKGVL